MLGREWSEGEREALEQALIDGKLSDLTAHVVKTLGVSRGAATLIAWTMIAEGNVRDAAEIIHTAAYYAEKEGNAHPALLEADNAIEHDVKLFSCGIDCCGVKSERWYFETGQGTIDDSWWRW